MMKRIGALLVAVTMSLAVAGCGGTEEEFGSVSQFSETQQPCKVVARPFHMTANWTTIPYGPDPRCDADDIWLEFPGEGICSHLGKCTLLAGHCTHMPTASDPYIRWYNGFWNMTAANGDVVYAEFHGVADQPGVNWVYAVDHVTVLGGTGRFANASGSITGHFYPDWSDWPNSMPIWEKAWGTLNY